jgi:hypothetical protein
LERSMRELIERSANQNGRVVPFPQGRGAP